MAFVIDVKYLTKYSITYVQSLKKLQNCLETFIERNSFTKSIVLSYGVYYKDNIKTHHRKEHQFLPLNSLPIKNLN